MAHEAEQAAKTLANEHGIEAEVIDPRTLRPLDLDTILESVRKTNRAVVVEEGWPHGGVGANLAALIHEQAFDHLDAPVQRVTGADVPMPYSKRLEQAAIPHAEHVVKAALATAGGSRRELDGELTSSCRASRTRWRRGRSSSWLKSVGDEVAVGDELVEIETDKANMVYEADAAGTLIEIVAEEGDTLPIGEVIARVGEAGEAAGAGGGARGRTPRPTEGADATKRGRPSGGRRPPRPRPAEATRAARLATADRRTAPATASAIKASPIARRIAREQRRRPRRAQRLRPGRADRQGRRRGRRRRAPPRRPPSAAEPRRQPPRPPRRARARRPRPPRGRAETVELTKLQQTVARRMAESKATAPHFYLQAEIDMSARVEARARIKAAAAEGEVVPSFNDMVVKACALALREFPRANGAYRDGRFELYSRVNVGIAVAAQDALVVPTVFDADRKGLREIAAERGRSPRRSATARSPRRSSRAAPSRSPTSACTGSTTSPR